MEGRITLLALDPPHGGCKRLDSACFEASVTLSKAMMRTSGHVLWLLPKTSVELGDPTLAPHLDSLGFITVFDSCRFGTPWLLRAHVDSTYSGVSRLGALCDGCSNHVSVQSFSPCGKKLDVIARQVWPRCADAIAVAFAGIMGTSVVPKCAHLAGFMAPAPHDSIMEC